jgi:hypothetical protein
MSERTLIELFEYIRYTLIGFLVWVVLLYIAFKIFG